MSNLFTLPPATVTLKIVKGSNSNQFVVTTPEMPALVLTRGDLTHSRVQTRNRGGVVHVTRNVHIVAIGCKRLRRLWRGVLTDAAYRRLVNA